MRALVTGASGFIGSHLLRELRGRGHEPVARVRASSKLHKIEAAAEGRPFELCIGDLEDPAALARCLEGVDIVYHVAGVTAAFDRETYERVNAGSCEVLFDAIARCEHGPKRVVLVSSLIAAGPSLHARARAEAHAITPTKTMYGDTKLHGEQIAWRAAQSGACEVVIVRPPLVYGPHDEDVLQMIRSAKLRVVAQPGLRGAWHSAIHVADLVSGIAAAGECGRPLPVGIAEHALSGQGLSPDRAVAADDPRGQGIYYLTDGERHTIASFGQTAAALMRRRALTIRIPRPLVKFVGWVNEVVGRIRRQLPALTLDKARASCLEGWWCDDSRARRELDYAPRYPLRSGLEDTIRWYEQQGIL